MPISLIKPNPLQTNSAGIKNNTRADIHVQIQNMDSFCKLLIAIYKYRR